MFAFLRHPLGWLLKSTDYLATKKIRSWHRYSQTYKDNCYWWPQRVMVSLTHRPLVNGLELAILAILFVINMHLWKVPVPFSGMEHLKKFDHLLVYFTSLWIIQATVAALTYPIVIGLVTFLFGQRDSSVQRLYIYLADSCAILMGVSSLALVLFMGIQYKFLWYYNIHDVEWTLIADLTWFCLNIAGTIYFLHRSFWFILPGQRSTIVFQYALTVTWREQARGLFKRFLLGIAHESDDVMPSVKGFLYIGSLWSNIGEDVVSTRFRRTRYLSHVNFRPMAIAVELWRRKLRATPRNKAHQGSEPTLTFPISFDLFYKGKTVICKVARGPQPGWLARLLVRGSIQFTRKGKPKDGGTVDEIVNELQADVLDAIAQRRQAVFESRYKDMIEFIVAIIQASEYGTDSAEKANISLLPSDSSGYERVYERWLNAHMEITEACVTALSDYPDFFRYACQAPKRYFLPLRGLAHIQIPRDTLYIWLLAFFRLDDWWVRTAEAQGFTNHGKCAPVVIQPPALSAYSEILDVFVGAYESIKTYYFTSPGDLTYAEWEDAQRTTHFNIAHIGHVLVMLFAAVAHGNKQGAESAVDMLQSWCDNLMLRMGSSLAEHHYGWRITTFDITARTAADARVVASAPEHSGMFDGEEAGLLVGQALRNLWIDHTCLAIYGLLQWAIGCECKSSLPGDLARTLIRGIILSEGASHAGSSRHATTRSELMAAIIRQQLSGLRAGANQETYSSVLNSVFQRLNRSVERRMISGRMYHSGGSGIESSRYAQLLYLMILPDSGWNAERNFGAFVRRLVADDRELAESLKIHLDLFRQKLDEPEFKKLSAVYSCVTESNSRGAFGSAQVMLKAQLGGVVQLFATHIDAAVAQTPINQGQLDKIAKQVSQTAFGRDSIAPVLFFQNIERAETVKDTQHIRFTNMDKSDFTKPPEEDGGFFDDEFADYAVRENVAAFTMSAVLRKLTPTSVDASTPEKYWTEFQRAASELQKRGLTPVLLLENRVVPKWIWEWTLEGHHEQGYLPPELTVTKKAVGENAGYEATLNGVDAFQVTLPAGESILMPKEAFDTVKFKTFKGAKPVDVTAEAQTANPARVDIVITWGQEVTIPDRYRSLATRLVYGKKVAKE